MLEFKAKLEKEKSESDGQVWNLFVFIFRERLLTWISSRRRTLFINVKLPLSLTSHSHSGRRAFSYMWICVQQRHVALQWMQTSSPVSFHTKKERRVLWKGSKHYLLYVEQLEGSLWMLHWWSMWHFGGSLCSSFQLILMRCWRGRCDCWLCEQFIWVNTAAFYFENFSLVTVSLRGKLLYFGFSSLHINSV